MDARDLKHLTNLPNGHVSDLTKYSALIITVGVAVLFLFRQYFFEGWLPRTKWYAPTWATLDESQRRSFMVHNIGAAMKILLIGIGLYPFVAVTFGNSLPTDPISAYADKPTMGDFMILTMQIFQVMYFFELFYRNRISYVTAAHHLGTIILGQMAVALTYNVEAEPDAVPEFVLCFTWGAFDVLGQLYPHIVMILYRLQPHRHLFLAKALYFTAFLEAFSPLVETAVVMWLFGSAWRTWTIQMKIITPILHITFKAAQVWAARVFWVLAKKEEKRHRQSRGRSPTGHAGHPEEGADKDASSGEVDLENGESAVDLEKLDRLEKGASVDVIVTHESRTPSPSRQNSSSNSPSPAVFL